MSEGRVLAVAGAKGGVGKTTTSLNLAAAFAEQGFAVVVVETDLAMANLVDFLNLEMDIEADTTLHEVLTGAAEVPEATYAAPGGIDALPSGVSLEGFADTRIELFPRVVSELRSRYDVVILDTGAGLNQEMLVPIELADEVLLVSTPRVAAVRDVEKTKHIAERVDTPVRGIVFSKSGTGAAPDPGRIAAFLDVELLGHVPEDDAVPTSQDAGVPVVEHAPESPAASAYADLARTLDVDGGPGPQASTPEADAGDGVQVDGAGTGDADPADPIFGAPDREGSDGAPTGDGETEAADAPGGERRRGLRGRVRSLVDRAVSTFSP